MRHTKNATRKTFPLGRTLTKVKQMSQSSDSKLAVWCNKQCNFIVAAHSATEMGDLLIHYSLFKPELIDGENAFLPLDAVDSRPFKKCLNEGPGVWVRSPNDDKASFQMLKPIPFEEAKSLVRSEYEDRVLRCKGNMHVKTVQDALISEQYLGYTSGGEIYAVRPEVYIPGTGSLVVTFGIYYKLIPQPFALYKESFELL